MYCYSFQMIEQNIFVKSGKLLRSPFWTNIYKNTKQAFTWQGSGDCGHLLCPGRNLRSWAWRSGSWSHPCAPSSSAPATPCSSHIPSQPSAKSNRKTPSPHFTAIRMRRERIFLTMLHSLRASELPRWSSSLLLDVNESVCRCVLMRMRGGCKALMRCQYVTYRFSTNCWAKRSWTLVTERWGPR